MSCESDVCLMTHIKSYNKLQTECVISYEVDLPNVIILDHKIKSVLAKLQTQYKDFLHCCVIKVKEGSKIKASYKLYRYCLMIHDQGFVEKVKFLNPSKIDCIVIDTNTNIPMKIWRLVEILRNMERVNV